MQSGRIVQLVRRVSTGESRLKSSVNFNQNITKECHVHNKNNELNDGKRFYRLLSSSNPFAAEASRVSFINTSDIIAKSMASSSSNESPHDSSDKPKYTNRLAQEKSPYLLQHAHNPVDWYPWGEEAVQKAKTENKLIFLSVGYSTCHWCHVMEHESFEDESVAEIMNKHYVNIKVDREERPDVDRVYMTFVQATSGRGGWPMSVFLTPELHPVTGGTYFPKEDTWGRPGFRSILKDLADKWSKQRQDFMTSGEHILEVLKKVTEMTLESSESGAPLPGKNSWKTFVTKYAQSYDEDFGGFGGAPKFPQPTNMEFLFHYYARNRKTPEGQKCLEMSLKTLKKMACGGIHDHISNGFARYSVDGKWHVPHFEKMLYDQAQLSVAYLDAYLATQDKFYADIVHDILTYVGRDLSHEEGGFYSAEDADSLPNFEAKEKQEGAFCVWEKTEIESLLDGKVVAAEDSVLGSPITYSDIFCHHFNVKKEGNVDRVSDPHGELTNKNVLIIFGSPEETALKFGISEEKVNEVLTVCKSVLYNERQKRPRPHLDTKILCSWNGLMISGFAKAGQSLKSAKYIKRAVKAGHFIKKYLYNEKEGYLLRSCYRGEDGGVVQIPIPIKGFLDDYVFFIRALLDLYEATCDRSWLHWAVKLQDKQDELFWDSEHHGYFTSPNESPVILRLKEDVDGAEPSGNSIAAINLIRMAALGGGDLAVRRSYAEKTLTAFGSRIVEAPTALPVMVSALMYHLDSPTQIFIAGERDDPRTIALLDVVRTRLLPARILAVAEPSKPIIIPPSTSNSGGNDDGNANNNSKSVLAKIRPINGVPAAFVCRHFACSLPVTSPDQLKLLLDEAF